MSSCVDEEPLADRVAEAGARRAAEHLRTITERRRLAGEQVVVRGSIRSIPRATRVIEPFSFSKAVRTEAGTLVSFVSSKQIKPAVSPSILTVEGRTHKDSMSSNQLALGAFEGAPRPQRLRAGAAFQPPQTARESPTRGRRQRVMTADFRITQSVPPRSADPSLPPYPRGQKAKLLAAQTAEGGSTTRASKTVVSRAAPSDSELDDWDRSRAAHRSPSGRFYF